MIRLLLALLLGLGAASTIAQEAPLQLVPDAPARHVVLPGDTLWGISARFLKDPWRWPQIWRLNRDEVRNPHRIYPGDVIVLEHDADGVPRLALQGEKGRERSVERMAPRVHAEDQAQPIPSIPTAAIAPFLSSPLVVDDATLAGAARIVATQDDRVFLGPGDTAYVADADPQVERWLVYRKGRPLHDPDTGELLGYEAQQVGNAQQVQPGQPARFRVLGTREEIGRGDRLLPQNPTPAFTYVPRRPTEEIAARIVAIQGGTQAGKFSVVVLNRGKREGLEVGHVLSLQRERSIVQRDEGGRAERIRVPDERFGLLFVFRTFERLSYALVLQADSPATVRDHARTP